jgi:hypothetical protein
VGFVNVRKFGASCLPILPWPILVLIERMFRPDQVWRLTK